MIGAKQISLPRLRNHLQSPLMKTKILAVFLFSAGALSAQLIPSPALVIGSANTAFADPPVSRPNTVPCVVQLFNNVAFNNFSPKFFTFHPPAGCPGPWAKVVLNADFSVQAGRQFDRTAEI